MPGFDERKFSLGEPEFESLIKGKIVTLAPDIKISLLDIGWARMQYLLEEAESEAESKAEAEAQADAEAEGRGGNETL